MLEEGVVPCQDVQIERKPADGKAEDDGDEHANSAPLALQQKEPPPLGEGAHRFAAPEEEANVEVAVGGDADRQDVLRTEGVQRQVNALPGRLEGVDLAARQGRHGRQLVHHHAAVLRVRKGKGEGGRPDGCEDDPGGQTTTVPAEVPQQGGRGSGRKVAGSSLRTAAEAGGAEAVAETTVHSPQGRLRRAQLAEEDVVVLLLLLASRVLVVTRSEGDLHTSRPSATVAPHRVRL